MYDSPVWVAFSLSAKLDVGLLHTKQQTMEFIQRSSIYGHLRTFRQTKPRTMAGLTA